MKQTGKPAKKTPAPRKSPKPRGKPKKNRRAASLETRARAALIAAIFTAAAVGAATLLLIAFGAGNARKPPPEAAPLPEHVATPADRPPAPPSETAGPEQPPRRETPASPQPGHVAVPADRPPARPPETAGPEQPPRRNAPASPRPAGDRAPAPAPPAARTEPAAERPAPQPAGTAPASRPERPQPLKRRGTVALVIDDAGNNLRELEPFLNFPGPLTIAVLPGLPHSAEAARRIRAAGKEVFLHQPMEALSGQNPGPQAVYSNMDAAEIRLIVSRNIDEIAPVAGLNNHQGSKITMDEKAMEAVLALCRERGIQFLDSRTTADTAAPEAARRLGMKIGERDIFLDNAQERAAMADSLEAGLARAEARGAAVMIGHTWSPELAPLLTELYPKLIEQGYAFSTASRLIKGEYGQ